MLAHPELTDTPEFRGSAWRIAQEMVQEVRKANVRSWREAAMKSGRARKIFESLQAEIQRTGIAPELDQIAGRNARLISSLPTDIAEHIARYASKQHLAGKRPAEIAKEIRRLAPRLTENRIKLISRTEISKAETQLTQARAERIGIAWYQWENSEDQRVRKSHRNMGHVLVAFRDPPDPEKLVGEKSNAGHYNAGATFQCRCIALPIASLDEIHWPARVYRAGSITRYTRAQFAKLSQMHIAA